MGTSKIEEFTLKQNKVAVYAKALAHPARVAIIELLIKKGACICGDIVDELPLSQSTISQHLKELKDATLIKGEITGKKVCYCLNQDAWKSLEEYFGKLIAPCTCEPDCC